MSNEVTISELISKFDVKKNYEHSTGWQADLSIVDKETNATNDVSLRWDEDYGYSIEFHNPVSDSLKSMLDRPEFEYVLDCVMRGDTD